MNASEVVAVAATVVVALVAGSRLARPVAPLRWRGRQRRPGPWDGGWSGRFGRRSAADVGALAAHLARSVRSGASLPGALEDALTGSDRPTGALVQPLVADLRGGASFPDAVERWAAERPEVRLLAAVLIGGHELGGVTARVLDETADACRARARAAADVRTQATTARLSAQVVAVAPLVGVVVAALAEPGALAFLVQRPAGRVCLLAGLAADATGAWWMSRLQRRVLAPW